MSVTERGTAIADDGRSDRRDAIIVAIGGGAETEWTGVGAERAMMTETECEGIAAGADRDSARETECDGE